MWFSFFFGHVLSAICFNFLPSSWWHQVWKIWSKSDLIHYKTKFLKIYYFENVCSTGCLSTLSLVWLILNLFSGPNILQTVFWKINDLISPVRSKVTIFGHLRAVRLKEVLLSNVAVITYRDVRVLTSLNRWKDCTFLTRPLECEKILLCLKFMQSDRFFPWIWKKGKKIFLWKKTRIRENSTLKALTTDRSPILDFWITF